ncbi:glutamate 5-kinase [Synechococcus sp. BIOS-E4-1]|uniref:glutamate 5-kinase n=1 Tax=Synechococcus sp. BIOS-E4-1 TaxID=1400864 RepID=UPI00164726FE|nr:glutamate 5-kinase [Synechococcus sp. BIOS-E4-1]QNI55023.1 glutamate 5-kinase [Synechococcus sp. BIOS-E4-1]
MTLRVVKVGTSLLRQRQETSTAEAIAGLSSTLAESMDSGDRTVLVSSGAVGLGCQRLGMKQRPLSLQGLQAAASVGQGYLMSLYEMAFSLHSIPVAQVLLTRADLEDRLSYHNASATLNQLLEWGVLPVVNENDTVSSDELKFGDNDTLSALVAAALKADELILLTDVDSLYSADPRSDFNATPIKDVHDAEQIGALEEGAGNGGKWGTGGMATKLAAARIATASGVTVHLGDGRKSEALQNILRGGRGGTVFHPHPQPLGNRKSWLAHALKPTGSLHLDPGACRALLNKGASLLLVGVTELDGQFDANQAVLLLDEDGQEVARGLATMSSEKLKDLLTRQSPNQTTTGGSPVVVHRDAMVLTMPTTRQSPD